MVAHRFVAVVGARVVPEACASQVAAVVRCFLERGWGVGSGGARGADQYALEAVVVTLVDSMEGIIGHAKTNFGLDRILYTVKDGEEMWIRLGLLAMNLSTALKKMEKVGAAA